MIPGSLVSLRLRSGTSPRFNPDPVSPIGLFPALVLGCFRCRDWGGLTSDRVDAHILPEYYFFFLFTVGKWGKILVVEVAGPWVRGNLYVKLEKDFPLASLMWLCSLSNTVNGFSGSEEKGENFGDCRVDLMTMIIIIRISISM